MTLADISQETKRRVHLALPFVMFGDYLAEALAAGLSLEVGLDHQALDLFTMADFKAAAAKLKKAGVKLTVHAPFCDLSPGAFDSLVQKASVTRLKQALEVACFFEPQVVVIHSGYHPGYHRERQVKWLELVRSGLEEVVRLAEERGLRLALENVFEPEPALLTAIVEYFASPALGYCFDAGHAYAFARSSWQPWLEAFRGRLFEIHVHDNDGRWDDHLPPGRGKIPFREIFAFLAKEDLKPVVTFEAHRAEDVLPGLAYLQEIFEAISW